MKPIPRTPPRSTPRDAPISYRLLKPESERSKTVVDNFGRAYVAGNIVEGNATVTRDNWAGGVQPDIKGGQREAVLKAIDGAVAEFAAAPPSAAGARSASSRAMDAPSIWRWPPGVRRSSSRPSSAQRRTVSTLTPRSSAARPARYEVMRGT